ncbi:mitotic-spindle organizing protein 2B-like [Mytilus edulis]|uniref:mitotic-spindle organizing protein 2B-like n=1 Tax=Mytilus edulis TaxID=6550 RepID=UPI0039EE764D
MSQQTLKYTLLSKNVLTLDEAELYELSQLAGITLDPNVFKIILDLLKMNVAPTAVLQMLMSMLGQQRRKPVLSAGERGKENGQGRTIDSDPRYDRNREQRAGSRGRVLSGSSKRTDFRR